MERDMLQEKLGFLANAAMELVEKMAPLWPSRGRVQVRWSGEDVDKVEIVVDERASVSFLSHPPYVETWTVNGGTRCPTLDELHQAVHLLIAWAERWDEQFEQLGRKADDATRLLTKMFGLGGEA